MIDAIRLRSRPFLSATARKSIARSDRVTGLGISLSRLERASLRGVLRAERLFENPRRSAENHFPGKQLLPDQLQFWPYSSFLDRSEGAEGLRGDTTSRQGQPGALRWARFCFGPGI